MFRITVLAETASDAQPEAPMARTRVCSGEGPWAREVILRAAPIAAVFEIVDTQNAVWMAAVLFGLSHDIVASLRAFPAS